MYSGNKGEWSELYALLKILGDGCIIGADENLNKIEDWKYPVEQIVRDSVNNNQLTYEINNDLGLIKILVDNNAPHETSQKSALASAHTLLSYLQKKQSASFQIPELENFWKHIQSPKMKASSSSKRDITLVIRDFKNRLQKEVGFSIKSRLGNASTLFNAGKATNFRYKILGIENLSEDMLTKAQSLKTMKLVKWLYEHDCTLQYENTPDQKFLNNLQIIDSCLDEIMACLTLGHYLGKGLMPSLVEFVSQCNPCDYTNDVCQDFYTYKTKQFLSASALGMTAKAKWDGIIDATGGYLVVKENGELVCYHIYNWNALQTYLFNHTRLETGSTTRHKFGYIYKNESNGYNIDLNLQVRFL